MSGHPQNPPCQGAFSTMNSHVISLLARYHWTLYEWGIVDSSFVAALMVFALSDINFLGVPLQLENRQNACRNMLVDKIFSISKWTASVDAQVNKHAYAFSEWSYILDCVLPYN